MLFLVVTLSLLALSASQTKFCCTPQQWESAIQYMSGSLSSQTKNATLTNGTMHYSVDLDKQMVAVTSILTTGDAMPALTKTILLYKTNEKYTIEGMTCKKSSPGQWRPTCLPDDATFLESNYYGSGSNVEPVDIYMFTQDTSTIYMNIAHQGCTPMIEAEYDLSGDTEYITTSLFTNFTKGINDPDVFTVPDICKQSEHQLDKRGDRNGLSMFGIHF